MSRVIFLCKIGHGYGSGYGSSGVTNSVRFLVDMLNDAGVPAKQVQVVDNNDIDREVSRFKATHAIIEALWVVPEKFDILKRLHSKVKWVVRIHSDIPFLAEEGVAIEWIKGYVKRGARVAVNSIGAYENLLPLYGGIDFLPNYYPHIRGGVNPGRWSTLRVGCFGAIRPMKNQLLQAIAAIRYADLTGRGLEFHINSTRCEGWSGESVLRNLRALFTCRHRLIEHKWLTHGQFLAIMAEMDVAMCVSMTETFCVVAADAIAVGVPLICSDQIPWASALSIVDTTDADAMIQKLSDLNLPILRHAMYTDDREGLNAYSVASRRTWLRYVGAEPWMMST